MVVDKINKYLNSKELRIDEAIKYEIEKLAGYTFSRQFMEDNEGSGKLRLSASGHCPRKLAYKYHKFEPKGKEIDGRARIIFWMGDLVEMIITELARLAGVPLLATGFRQLTVEMDVDGEKITGHPDGLILDNGEIILLEVKSMSDFAFTKFDKKGEIDDGYLSQVNCYMDCLNIKKTLFVALDKNNAVMSEKLVKYDQNYVKKAINGFREVLNSTKNSLPKPRYKADEKGFYPWQCLYCNFWGYCHPNAKKVLVKNRYKLMESKK